MFYEFVYFLALCKTISSMRNRNYVSACENDKRNSFHMVDRSTVNKEQIYTAKDVDYKSNFLCCLSIVYEALAV